MSRTSVLAEMFDAASSFEYILGSAMADTLNAERLLLPGGWLAGGLGDDRYLLSESMGHGIHEAPGEGADTVVCWRRCGSGGNPPLRSSAF